MYTLVNSFVSSVGSSWCQLMHPDPMWPVNGEYQCRVCFRKYPVAWEQPVPAPVNKSVNLHPAPTATESIAAANAGSTFN